MLKNILIGSSILLTALTLNASDSDAPQPLTVTVEREPLEAAVSVYRAYVSVQDRKYTFLIPENYRVGGNPANGRLDLDRAEGDGHATFSFLGSGVAGDRDSQRDLLAKKYNGGKIVAEFSRPAAGGSGRGYDIEWEGPGGLKEKTRALYVSTSLGILELTITANLTNFNSTQSAMNQWIATMDTSTGGNKLVVHRLADRS